MGWFSDKASAKAAAKGRYIMGSDCPIKKVDAHVIVFDNGEMYLLGKLVKGETERQAPIKSDAGE